MVRAELIVQEQTNAVGARQERGSDRNQFRGIDHAVKIAGIDHVRIGSDFDGISGPPNGLDDVSKMPALIAVLLKRGYAKRDLKKILGENFLRMIREVTGK